MKFLSGIIREDIAGCGTAVERNSGIRGIHFGRQIEHWAKRNDHAGDTPVDHPPLEKQRNLPKVKAAKEPEQK